MHGRHKTVFQNSNTMDRMPKRMNKMNQIAIVDVDRGQYVLLSTNIGTVSTTLMNNL